MSISNLEMQYALRTQLLTMEPATTGSISLEVTSSGFVRSSGSFVTDGFEPGMEVLGAGFSAGANNDRFTIDSVVALTLNITGLTVEGSGSGRTLSVGLPIGRAWENIKFTPITGEPFIEEEFLSGPSSQITVGSDEATLRVDPLYVVKIFAPEHVGVAAPNRYADAVLLAFKPNRKITLTNGDVMRVRTDTSPFRGQLTHRRAGWVVVPVTVPLFLFTQNS